MNIANVISAITLSITFLTVSTEYFRKRDSIIEENNDKYVKVLYEYFRLKKIYPSTINPIDYFKNLKYKEYCIPNYIFYATENYGVEDFEKILTVDYWKNVANFSNNTSRTIDRLFKLFTYTTFLLIAGSIIGIYLMGAFFGEDFIKQLISDNSLESLPNAIIGTLIIVLIIVVLLRIFSKIFVNMIDTVDSYSLKKDVIQRRIKSRLKYYEKNKNKYYL